MGNGVEIMEHGYFYSFNNESLPDLRYLGEGFEFDWTTPITVNQEVVGYIFEGDVLGLVKFESITDQLYNVVKLLEVSQYFRNRTIGSKLLAYVARDSFNKGFDGFVVVESKTVLKSYYVNRLGGMQIGNSNLIRFDSVASQRLVDQFLKEEY